MNLNTKYWIIKRLCFVVVFSILFQAISPLSVMALTSGPNQPEFSGFEPVATTNMVNEFTGDFTYNLPVIEIPGANGGGYAMSLSYHSGASPEEEASWVGYGWSLNPGAINRSKRGFPDDYNGQNVRYWNKTPKNWTVSVGGAINGELFSFGLGASANATLRYNSYKGFGYTAGVGLSQSGINLGFNVSDGQQSFSAKINPVSFINAAKKDSKKDETQPSAKPVLTGEETKAELRQTARKYATDNRKNTKVSDRINLSLAGSNYGIFSPNESVRSLNIPEYKGGSFNVTVGVMPTLTILQGGPSGDIFGNYTYQNNVETDDHMTYGYMYSSEATDEDAMMDYYTEKENPFDKRDKFLGLPFSNKDNFVVTGEGIGGGFRLHNKRAGHFRPNAMFSRINIVNLGAEVEAGGNIGAGLDVGVGRQELRAGAWNNLTAFAGTGDEPNFFRFSNDLGGSVEFGSNDEAQRASIVSQQPNVSAIEGVMNNNQRSGRSSYIGFHTNHQMTQTSSNGNPYYSYELSEDLEDFINRYEQVLSDQIGELVVFNEDGTRYTYGLPVYSRNEKNLQYGVQGATSGQVTNNYLVHKNVSNSETKVGEERDVPYATSYLLTSIVSPDYIDRNLNGPDDFDFGGWTKFEYERAHGSLTKIGSNGECPIMACFMLETLYPIQMMTWVL